MMVFVSLCVFILYFRGGDDDDDETEDQQVQKIIDQFVAQVALESSSGSSKESPEATKTKIIGEEGTDAAGLVEVDSDLSSDDDISEDEMCRICDCQATLRCKECDGDIFCSKCFQEFHRELGENHKSKPFKKK